MSSAFTDLYDLFDRQPGTASILTDDQLSQLMGMPPGDPDRRARLIAESLVRHWLYEDRVPGGLREALESAAWLDRESFAPLRSAFQKLMVPLRHSASRIQSEEVCGAAAELGFGPFMERVWSILCDRVRTFVDCDGLLGLVPPKNPRAGDGVAVPFRLNRAGKFRDGEGADIPAWLTGLAEIQNSYPLPIGADLAAIFPASDPPKGNSWGLPLILALERAWAVDIPEFDPLSVLASGEVKNGVLKEVQGLEAKRALSGRLGCKLFLTPQARGKGNPPVTAGEALQAGLPRIGREIEAKAGMIGAVKILEHCRQTVQDRGFGKQEAGAIIRRLIHVRKHLTGDDLKLCDVVLGKAAKCMEVGGYFTVQREIEVRLDDYRSREVFGRDLILDGLKQFLTKSSGLKLVLGRPGYGKTSLLTSLLDRIPAGLPTFRHFFSVDRPATREVKGFYDSLGLFLSGLLRDPSASGRFYRDDILLLWDELERSGYLSRNRLLLVLDGLDEALEQIPPPIPELLPKGLLVVAALRSADTERSERYLDAWKSYDGNPIDVGALDDVAIRDWLSADDNGLLRQLGLNGIFREQLLRRTRGCPRFIADLLEHLVRLPMPDRDWADFLNQVPNDYRGFVSAQLRDLRAQPGYTPSVDRFLGLLCAAEGELDDEELHDLLNDVPNLPWQCDRWVAQRASLAGRGLRYILQTPLFREALRDELAWKPQEDRLLNYCREWERNNSPYALRHLGTHLANRGEWVELSKLILNESYRKKLRDTFQDNDDISLQILRLALIKALAASDWTGLSEIMLTHAEYRRQTMKYEARGEEPSETISADMAMFLKQADPARSKLWTLVSAWCAVWQERPEDLERLRCELASSRRMALAGLESDIAAELLARVFEPGDERLERVAAALLDQAARARLVRHLAEEHTDASFGAARRVLRTIQPSRRDRANRDFVQAAEFLAIELAHTGQWQEIKNLLPSVLHRQRSLIWYKVGRVAASLPDLEALRFIRAELSNLVASCRSAAFLKRQRRTVADLAPGEGTPTDRIVCLGNLARVDAVLATVADEAEARDYLASALSRAKELTAGGAPTRSQFIALVAIVETVAERPGIDSSASHPVRRYFARALRSWRALLRHDHESFVALSHDLVMLMEAGNFIQLKAAAACPRIGKTLGRLRRTLAELSSSWLSLAEQDDLWYRLAEGGVKAGLVEIPLSNIARIGDKDKRARAVSDLVSALCRRRQLKLAYEIGENNKGLKQSIFLAIGLATLGYDPENATRQILVRLLPNPFRLRHQSFNLDPLVAEIAVAFSYKRNTRVGPLLWEKAEPYLEKKRLREVKPAHLRRVLNFADAAYRAGDCDLACELLKNAVVPGERNAAALLTKARSGAAAPPAYQMIEVVETLGATAKTQKRLEEVWQYREPAWIEPWDRTVDMAHQLALELPGLSNRMVALTEVAEVKRYLGQHRQALRIFEEMLSDADRALAKLGKRAFGMYIASLGEIALGLVKSSFFAEARDVEAKLQSLLPPNPTFDDTALRAFAILHTRENDLRVGIQMLHGIRNDEIRAKTARDIAAQLLRFGRWRAAVDISGSVITRRELKQSSLHRLAREILSSDNLTPTQQRFALIELLWPCSESFDSAYLTLAWLVRGTPSAARNVFQTMKRWNLVTDPLGHP